MVYEPREDSFLMIRVIKELDLRGDVALDMGCGSGIITEELCRRFKEVYAVDIDEEALKATESRCKNFKNLRVLKSFLFRRLPPIKFDLITFNPPYLPCGYEEDPEVCCGENCTLLDKFLAEAPKWLKKDGIVLIVLSSLTPLKLRGRIVARKKLPFEELFVVAVTKSVK